ncbi:MAG TPA: site-specific DNA-methyltransferase, partial [Ruminococcaceae bacterium]|nr:site-specific DNA-methyltransferase [Oscillospiraceae bacterium]
AYEFTWVGKRAAIAEAGRPIRKTLRPCVEESKNWDNTENLYIEGDNLNVLKLLQESYLGKVKMIYIDPPYNTGNDFVYRDNFVRDKDEYDEEAGIYDEDGDRLFRNAESNGRFHSDWCSMIYPRLVLARNLLRDDGAIFISIDDGELDNVLKITHEVFGASNLVAIVPRIAKRTSDKGTHFRPTKDYVVVYAKKISFLPEFGIAKIRDENEYNLAEQDGRRYKKSGASLFQPSLDSRPNQRYYIEAPDGSLIIPPGTVFPTDKKDGAKVKPISNVDKVWRWSVDTYLRQKHLLIFTQGSSQNPLLDEYGNQSKWNVYPKVYFDEDVEATLHPEDVIYDYPNSQGTKELNALGIPFSFSKPSGLLSFLIRLPNDKQMMILDFFSGSATTAHAVMQLNAEDGGNRKFIMVQLPEPCAPDSEAAKAGYKNICEIGKERIRRAGEKIKADNAGKEGIENLDIGFRVLKLDDTNMKDVYYTAGEYNQNLLTQMEDNIKEDRTDMDLLYACLLDWGLPLSMPHTQEKIDGFTVHTYNSGDLIACFDKHISDAAVKEIARRQPLRAVFRDSSFASSPAKINV